MPNVNPITRKVALWTGWLTTTVAALGVMVGYGEFVKVKIGPFYILEVLFLIVAGCAMLTTSRQRLHQFVRLSWPAFLFLAWGVILIGLNLFHAGLSASLPYSRIAQHAILITYPVMWIFVGFWCLMTQRVFSAFLAYLLLAFNALPNFFGRNITNIAAGPLLILPFLYLVYHLPRHEKSRFILLARWSIIAGSGFFAFLPFWIMWNSSFQRTSLLELLVSIVLVPWFLKTRDSSIWRGALTTLAALVFLIFGFYVYSNQEKICLVFSKITTITPSHFVAVPSDESNPLAPFVATGPASGSTAIQQPHEIPSPVCRTPTKKLVVQRIAKRFYHGEDTTEENQFILPQMHTRRYMWKSALEVWWQHPIFGIGFFDEVPREVALGVKNDGGFVSPGSPPVSGPHNSYLSILTRTGLIGLLLFSWMIFKFNRQALKVYHSGQPIQLFDLIVFMIPLNGAIHALLNVGFESPARAMLMWLFLGLLMARYASLEKQS